MLRPIDSYFENHPEPTKSYLAFLRTLILKSDTHVTESWKYRMPFYCYNGKMFCYLWVHKKYKKPYIGFVEGKLIDHPDLLTEKRARMKILLLDTTEEIPVKEIKKLLKEVIALYK